MIVTLKIKDTAGVVQHLPVDTDKFHETWWSKCLAYGVRRLPNDAYSGDKGDTKVDLVKALLADMESGKEAPVKVGGSGKASGDPVIVLGTKNAKADLLGMFKVVTGSNKAIDFAQHEKCAKFFTIADGKANWNEVAVAEWMVKQLEAGKRDYFGDAKALIEAAKDVDLTF